MFEILYIDKEKFVQLSVESFLPELVYSVDTIIDSLYLIDDLSIRILVVDIETIGKSVDLFFKEYIRKYKHIPLVITGTNNQIKEFQIGEYDGLVKEYLYRPFSSLNIRKLLNIYKIN